MLGVNTVPHTSAARIFGAGKITVIYVIKVPSQITVAKSHTLARRIPTSWYQHSLNTFKVSLYRNYTVFVVFQDYEVSHS
jgi:hypothetical protein